MAFKKKPVNCQTEEELRSIPGISSRLASTIVDVRNRFGNLTAESFQTLTRQSLSENMTQLLDFTPNRQYLKYHTELCKKSWKGGLALSLLNRLKLNLPRHYKR
ncbi:hypothetical protein DPMN_111855 [Dreissena polymorpha]|uniref:Uncharacterized protein n=1 Tax=Dreissena polymorpha TaxID=45954 RepID=A0A9D4KF16_DREPO|nr:hypothetical protein DPMN_111855 [Dreissena polymorpha]